MKAVNDKIIVQSDPGQKNTFIFNGVEMKVPLLFEKNFREKSPVICQVIEGNEVVSKDEILICHHNTFYLPSPYHLSDDLFSIPANGKIIFCKLNIHDGSLLPIYGNLLCDKVTIPSEIPLPPSETKQYTDRATVVDSGYTNFKKAQLLFLRPYGWYEIVWNWNNELRRTCKTHEEQVTGIYIPDLQ